MPLSQEELRSIRLFFKSHMFISPHPPHTPNLVYDGITTALSPTCNHCGKNVW